ncbi:hypothetical protein CPC08DRAFT_703669 [Agrocybe pediades]|nr:hypothetical protein CPC08DRAFT_703669 [Agrocybe pediades]
MAKNTKKPTPNHGTPITAYFTRVPKTPTSSQDCSPQASSQSRMPTKPPSKATPSQDVKAESSKSSVTVKSSAFKTKPLPSTNGTGVLEGPSASSGAASSRKRSRSPEPGSSSKNDEGLGKSMAEGNAGVDVEMRDVSGHIDNMTQPQLGKKRRTSSPLKQKQNFNTEVIPSSQSDEELPLWTAAATVPDSATPAVEPSSCPTTPDRVNQHDNATSQAVSPSLDRPRTPSFGDLPSVPATPVALDVASKTAKIIADIKARAYARELSSPEPTLEFNDAPEISSDEEEDILPITRIPIKTKKSPSPKIPSPEPAKRSTRYGLRNRSPPKTSANEASTSKLALGDGKKSPQTTRVKKSVQSAPFESLLREKRSATKRGDAFDRAEAVVNKVDTDGCFMGEDFDFEGADETLTWEDVNLAARDSRWVSNSTTTPNKSRAIKDIKLGTEDQKRLFGEERMKEIAGMLQHDRLDELNAAASIKVPGIKLWTDSSTSSMHAERDKAEAHIPRIPGTSAPIQLLNAALCRKDFSRAVILLSGNILSTICPSDQAAFESSLCELALSSIPHGLAEAAFGCLECFWNSRDQPLTSGISFGRVLSVLHRFKADDDILTAQKWQANNSQADEEVHLGCRGTVLNHLVLLIAACARSNRLSKQEIPDIVLVLLLLAADVTASAEFLQDITQAISLVCACISVTDLQIALNTCSKILAGISSYSPIIKHRIVSLLADGSATARRIASTVAYCIITDTIEVDASMFNHLPPLADILDQLPPYSKSKGPSAKFSIHEETDYVDLGLNICILAVAVADVKGYVFQEAETLQKQPTYAIASPAKNSKDILTEVQYLHTALENLHSSIIDLRAAHLERSRTKAIIKGLSMNLYYQHKLWSERARSRPQVTIATWLHKPQDRI